MGACCCAAYQVPQVLEDPSITVKARVGHIGIGTARVARLKIQVDWEGVMFVDGDNLRYTAGKLRCCEYSTKVQNITNVEVVDNGYVVVGGGYVVLSPGLKISLNNGSLIAVAVPEAHGFADMLKTKL